MDFVKFQEFCKFREISVVLKVGGGLHTYIHLAGQTTEINEISARFDENLRSALGSDVHTYI